MTENKLEDSTWKTKGENSLFYPSVNCNQGRCEFSTLSDTSCQEQIDSDREPITSKQNQLQHKIKETENNTKIEQQEIVLHTNEFSCQNKSNMTSTKLLHAYSNQDNTEMISDDSNINMDNSLHHVKLHSPHSINVSTIEYSPITVTKRVERLISEEERKGNSPIKKPIDSSISVLEETKEISPKQIEISSCITASGTKVKDPLITIDTISSTDCASNKNNASTDSALTITTRLPYSSGESTEIGMYGNGSNDLHTDMTTKTTTTKLESQIKTDNQGDEKVMISTRVKDVVTGYQTLKKNPILATVVWLLGGSTSEIDPITPPLPPQYKRRKERKKGQDSKSSFNVNSDGERNHKIFHHSDRDIYDGRDTARRSVRKNGCTQSTKRHEDRGDRDEIIRTKVQREEDHSNLTDFKVVKDEYRGRRSGIDNNKNDPRTGLKHPKRLQWNQVTPSGNDIQTGSSSQQPQPTGSSNVRKESIMYYYDSNDSGSGNGRDSISSNGSSSRRISYEEANTSPQWGWYVSLTPPTPNFSKHINNTPPMAK